MRAQKDGSRVRSAVLAAALVAGTSAACHAEEFINVPLVINILKDAGISEEDAKKAVEAANEVYKQAKVKFSVTKVNKDVAKPGDGDDKLSREERDKLRADGINELKDGLGVKVTFVNQVNEDAAGTTGVAMHKNPVAIVGKNRVNNTVAHELGHVLTLNYDLYGAGDKNRLMYGYTDYADTQLTEAERNEIRKEAEARSKKQEKQQQVAPSQPSNSQTGLGAHPEKTNAGAPGHQNVWMAMVNSNATLPDFSMRLTLESLVPPSGQGTFRFLFDSDSNAGTGQMVAGKMGVDLMVRADVAGPGVAQFHLETPGPLPVLTPLGGTMIREEEIIDVIASPDLAIRTPGQDVLDIVVPKGLLSLSGSSQFGVRVISGDPLSPADSFDLMLDLMSDHSGPQIATPLGVVSPLQSVPLMGMGFTPDSMIELTLDDLLLGSVMADSAGVFSTMLTMPGSLPDSFYYITALDVAAGDFGFSVVNAVPEPAALVLALPLALLLRRRRA